VSTPTANKLFKLFEGWRAQIDASESGFKVTVPRMSEGAAKVLKTEIQAEVPEAYDVRLSATPEGGWLFVIAIEAAGPDSVARLLTVARSSGAKDLEAKLEEVARESDPASQANLLARIALELEDRRELELARRAVSLAGTLAPTNVKLKFNHAVLLLKMNDLASAVELFEDILELDPEFEPALHNLAAFHAKRGERKVARDYLARLVNAHPGSAAAQVLAGQIAHDEGKLGLALEHFLRAIRMDENHAEAHYRAAMALRDLEMNDRAREHWRRYRTLAGAVPEGRYLAVRLLVEGDPPGAAIGLDGVPMGTAPRAFMNVPPGKHILAVNLGLTEITVDLSLDEGQNYLAKYDVKRHRVVYSPTVVDMTIPDEDGTMVTGPDLARKIIERVNQPLELVGLTSRQVFATVLYECLKDGQLNESEKDLVFGVKQLLRITSEVHQQVFKEIGDRIRGGVKSDATANPEDIYRLLARRALEDGSLVSEENQLLDEIGRMLQIDRAKRREIEKSVGREFSANSN
jgi:tetratricopeptide (TPR) repeat protein